MNPLQFIKTVFHPEWYHGALFKPPFFEGWYFKVVSADQKQAFAFIPGIYLDPDPHKSHAFIQVLEGNSGLVHEIQYPVADFEFIPDPFEIRIAGSRFSLTGLWIDMTAGQTHLRGEIHFDTMIPWPVRFYSPGIMGWFGWLSMMECYHGLLGFDHEIHGELQLNGEKINLDQGRGYIEKDWGKAFPSSWIWMQSNHFPEPGVSLSASIAVIPFLGLKFTGVIVGLWRQGKLYSFATYNGARVTGIKVTAKEVHFTMHRGRYRLFLKAEREKGGILAAPTLNGMDRRIAESLKGRIQVELYRRNRIIFRGTGERAGLEIVGNISELSR